MISNIEIDCELLPQYQQINFNSISDNAPIANAIGWMIFFIPVYAITIGGYINDIPLIIEKYIFVFSIEVALNLLSVYWCFYSHRYKGYALREHDVIYKTGVIWRKKTILPFNRIQHIETHQNLLQRKLNITSIRLFTAGGLKADMVIDGMDSKTSDEIKQFLLSKIQQEIVLNEQS
ncbi:MAG: PH domain-containing protein [Gammaproteobacteria bacterium]|nr:PH domain-containing protein [Gammaproteobacteria bacterium]